MSTLYTRYREKDEVIELMDYSAKVDTIYDREGVPPTQTEEEFPNSWSGWTKVQKSTEFWDNVIKHYHRRSAAGEIFNNPMQSTVVTTTKSGPNKCSRHCWEYDDDGMKIGYKSEGSDPGTWSMWTPHKELSSYLTNSESLIAKAVTQAHANVTASAAQALMMGAEGRKTVAGLGVIFLRALRIMKAAKKLDVKYLKNEFSYKELQDRYMELRYAIRPLIIDAKNVTAAYNAELGKSMRCTFRGQAEDSNVESDTVSTLNAGMRIEIERTVAERLKVRTGILTDVDGTELSVWGFDQWLETALEITPWSFIVNWFINIGDYLCAWTPNLGVSKLASWYTLEHTITKANTMEDGVHEPAKTHEGLERKDSQITTTVVKTRVPNPPLAGLPQIAVNLDMLKILDLTIIFKKLLFK